MIWRCRWCQTHSKTSEHQLASSDISLKNTVSFAMSQLDTHQGLPSLLLYRRPASLMETLDVRQQGGSGTSTILNPNLLSEWSVIFQSGALRFEMHGATIFGRYERHWSITSPKTSFPLDLRCPPVCVKSERPLKQLWVNRWLSVPQRCKDVQSKPPKWTVEATGEPSKTQNDRYLIWSIWIWSRYNHAPWTTARSAQILWTLQRCETCRWASGGKTWSHEGVALDLSNQI